MESYCIPVRKPLVGAHRRASSLAPENTLASFGLALELDVHLSADGEIVVILLVHVGLIDDIKEWELAQTLLVDLVDTNNSGAFLEKTKSKRDTGINKRGATPVNSFLVFIPLITGILLALQGMVISAGSRWFGTSEMIVGLSLVQAVPPFLMILAQRPVSQIIQTFPQGYRWYLMAGIIGVVAVAVVSLLIPRMGVLSVLSLIILGQIVGSAVLDHIGLFGCPKIPITPLRIVGIAFIVFGIILLLKSGTPKAVPPVTSPKP